MIGAAFAIATRLPPAVDCTLEVGRMDTMTRRRRLIALGAASALVVAITVTNGTISSQAVTAAGSMASDITAAPVRPPVCTTAQTAALNIDNCTVYAGGSGTPADHGFPAPPFPVREILTVALAPEAWVPLAIGSQGTIVTLLQRALRATTPGLSDGGTFGNATAAAVRTAQAAAGLPVTGVVDAVLADLLGVLVTATIGPFPPAGWVWNGNTYSGSPALADWEARMVAGVVKADPDISPLFEGFIAQLQAGSYRIDEKSSYGFRCTATTVRNCSGLDQAQLSYHAWGAALDVNWTQNPLQTVTSPTDACGTAAEHAMPDWVLAQAMHWGLFWGGWYSCPKTGSRSAVRDPHHFEFRGTPDLARRILAKNASPGTPNPPVPATGDLLLSCGDRGVGVATLRALLAPDDRPVESALLADTFTTTLAAALVTVQTRLGLPATGTLDPTTAAALGVTVRHTEVFPVLHQSSCGEPVRALQRALGVPVTGLFTTTTLGQLRTWQRGHGLAPTGITDTATAAALGLRVTASGGGSGTTTTTSSTTTSSTTTSSTTTSTTSSTTTTTVDPSEPMVTVPLKPGARSASVTALQEALTAAGYPTPAVGRFGSATAASLRRFKADAGLPITSTLTMAAAQLLGLTPVPSVPTRPGQRGEHVQLLQIALRAEGFAIAADGRFGPGTKAALKIHQQRTGVKVTGILDAATAKTFGW